MKATQTYYLDLRRLAAGGRDANLAIRLMRAADDIALANWGLRHFSQQLPRLQRHVQDGARRYFVRLQCGHLREGLKLVEQLSRSRPLMAVLAKVGDDVKEAYNRLCACLPGGSLSSDFDRYIKGIRNKIAFHYDEKLIDRALADRTRRSGSRPSSITRGTDISLWRSGLADDIEDSAVCRLIWRIPDSADLRAEADRIVGFGSDLCKDFLDLVGHVAFEYVRDTAAR